MQAEDHKYEQRLMNLTCLCTIFNLVHVYLCDDDVSKFSFVVTVRSVTEKVAYVMARWLQKARRLHVHVYCTDTCMTLCISHRTRVGNLHEIWRHGTYASSLPFIIALRLFPTLHIIWLSTPNYTCNLLHYFNQIVYLIVGPG